MGKLIQFPGLRVVGIETARGALLVIDDKIANDPTLDPDAVAELHGIALQLELMIEADRKLRR